MWFINDMGRQIPDIVQMPEFGAFGDCPAFRGSNGRIVGAAFFTKGSKPSRINRLETGRLCLL
jgi:hypothetical protein